MGEKRCLYSLYLEIIVLSLVAPCKLIVTGEESKPTQLLTNTVIRITSSNIHDYLLISSDNQPVNLLFVRSK